MKVFSYIGSFRGEQSNCLKALKCLIEELEIQINKKIDINIITPNLKNIKTCVGCNNCFNFGSCIFDDDILEIQKQMEEADMIIIGSPVFLHQVPGNLKTLFDRIAFWTHLLKLVGKYGVVISVSDGNGEEEVDSYVTKVLQLLGVTVIGNIKIPFGLLSSEDSFKSIVEVCSKKIAYYIKAGEFPVNNWQEHYFEKLKRIMRNKAITHSEWKYWNNNNLFNLKTFRDLINSKRERGECNEN